MQSKKGMKDAGIIIGILALILFGIIIFASSSSTDSSADDDLEDIADLESNFSAELLSANPGIIEQKGGENITELEIEIDEFTVNGVPTELTERLASEDETVVIQQSAFSGNTWLKTATADEETVEAALLFDVGEITGDGEVKVYINDEKIASQLVSEGKVVRMSIPLSTLHLGAEENETSDNKIEIRVKKPFWLLFWKTNSVTLKDIIFEQQIYDTDIARKEFILEFAAEEVIGIDSATLKTKVKLTEGAESKKLIITFQNETIYDSVPSAKETFETDIPGTLFDGGDNSLAIETEINGGYEVEGTLFYNVLEMDENAYKDYKITIGENIWPYVKNGQTDEDYECTLFMRKSSGDEAIKIWVNNHRMEYSFVSDKIDANICNYLVEGENSIKLISKDFIRLESVRLRIERK